MSTPTSSEGASPCCRNRNCGMMIKLLIILCFIVPFVLAAMQISYFIASLILLVGIILSIVAIVKGSKAFGITMLIVIVLVGGPGSFVLTYRDMIASAIEQGKVQVTLEQKRQAAEAAGNKEEASKIQAEMDAAKKQFEEKWNKITQ